MPYTRRSKTLSRNAIKRKPRRNIRVRYSGPTRLSFTKMSSRQHQPMPDRLFTTLELNDSFHTNTGGSTGIDSFAFSLSELQAPFSISNTTHLFPNPQVQSSGATGAISPAGLSNLLTNFTRGTGIYTNYRVWGAKVSITVTPTNSSDAVHAAMAPVINSNEYSNNITMSQGPDATSVIANLGGSPKHQTLHKYWSLPKLLGISRKDYATTSLNSSGSDGSPPGISVWCQFAYATLDNTALTNPLSMFIKVKYYVEFFQRSDTALLDN